MNASKRILVINDTKEILELFRDFLEGELGHQVTLMSFAPDELDRIADEKPDLIIIDFVIGDREMEGWQLLEKLRMFRPTSKIPVLACTAAVRQVRDQEAYLLEQGIEVVLKPFGLDQLEGAVRRALGQEGGAASVEAIRRSRRQKPKSSTSQNARRDR